MNADRVASAHKVIDEAMERAEMPALMFSGGKESTVLHHMLPLEVTRVVLYDEVQPERLQFIERIFRKTPFLLLNFWPVMRGMVPTSDGLDLVKVYDVRGEGTLHVATTPVHSGDLCIFDWKNMPVRECPEFCFDLLISGGRADDHHDYFGMPYNWERRVGSLHIVDPLYDWSEYDVWNYIEENGVEYDTERYDQFSDTHLDTLGVCTRCMGTDGLVDCPKYGMQVEAARMRKYYLK